MLQFATLCLVRSSTSFPKSARLTPSGPKRYSYISRGGGPPVMTPEDFSRDLITVANFILWHEDNDIHALIRPPQAFAALCRLLNVEQHVIRKILRPDLD